MAHWHKYNPWKDDVVYLPTLESAAWMLKHLNENISTPNGVVKGTIAWWIEHWQQYGKKLDPYILPQPSGDHCLGIRYGKRSEDYYSPYGDREKMDKFLKMVQS